MATDVETAVRDKLTLRLRELDLTTHEALTYVALLVHPNITASVLCKETGIPDSKIYYALHALAKKGMIAVQQGTPKLYKALHPKEAINNLKQQLKDRLNEKLQEADTLAELMTPLYKSVEESGELELAYIIRGKRNIVNRMKNLIETAQEELTIYISNMEILKEIQDSLAKAKDRRVKTNLALTNKACERGSLSYREIKHLNCPIDMLVSDMKTLLTVSSWTSEIAFMTHDQNLIRVSRNYYDNPLCCTID